MPHPVTRFAESQLPTTHGEFRVVVYRSENGSERDQEHLALIHGTPSSPALVRVHSECLTGEAFGSLRCDCRAQLDLAFQRIAADGAGVVVYLRQEGRGIGLGNKIRAYALQDDGADTVSANETLGFSPDQRSYEVAASILQDLGISEVRLMTNNPAKVAGLEAAGVTVHERIGHWTGAGPHNSDYLEAKRERMGHVTETGTDSRHNEQDAS